MSEKSFLEEFEETNNLGGISGKDIFNLIERAIIYAAHSAENKNAIALTELDYVNSFAKNVFTYVLPQAQNLQTMFNDAFSSNRIKSENLGFSCSMKSNFYSKQSKFNIFLPYVDLPEFSEGIEKRLVQLQLEINNYTSVIKEIYDEIDFSVHELTSYDGVDPLFKKARIIIPSGNPKKLYVLDIDFESTDFNNLNKGLSNYNLCDLGPFNTIDEVLKNEKCLYPNNEFWTLAVAKNTENYNLVDTVVPLISSKYFNRLIGEK